MNLPDITLILSVQLAAAVLIAVFARRFGVPLTVVLAVAGFIAGELTGLHAPLEGDQITDVIIFLFLPILVFEAALSLDPRSVLRNINAILALAIPALLIAAVLIGGALHLGFGMALATALLFGVLISATDPVAVTAVFRDLGVPRRLLTIVEGESLFNDGVAIVLFNIVLVAALGGTISVSEGFYDFVVVFLGGIIVGSLIGLAVAAALPWLDRLPAAALSVATAYGSFTLSEHIFGFSGVVATVVVGQILSGLAPSRASAEVREVWHQVWEALGFVANALLFLMIGAAIDGHELLDNRGKIVTAIVLVLIARVIAVVPLVSALERIGWIPRFGIRSQSVLIWGGLRGGVALALALSLPEELPERELLIAMTGGVVLATLVINATTISTVIRVLGLNTTRRTDRVLAGGATLSGIAAARDQLERLGLMDRVVSAELHHAELAVRLELRKIALTPSEERSLVLLRGLYVTRETYSHLRDIDLIQPSVARRLVHEVNDQIDRVSINQPPDEPLGGGEHPLFDRLLEHILAHLPDPNDERKIDLTYEEATARQLASRRARETLELLVELPNISMEAVQQVQAQFLQWEEDAIESLSQLDEQLFHGAVQRRQQALAIRKLSTTDDLSYLVSSGLLPESIARTAEQTIVSEVTGNVDFMTTQRHEVLELVEPGMVVLCSADRPVGNVESIVFNDDAASGLLVSYGESGDSSKLLTAGDIQYISYGAVCLRMDLAEFLSLPDA